MTAADAPPTTSMKPAKNAKPYKVTQAPAQKILMSPMIYLSIIDSELTRIGWQRDVNHAFIAVGEISPRRHE